MSLQHEPDVLPQAVGDEVEIARPRAHAFRLRPLDVMLEAVEPAPDPARPRQTDQVLGWLDVDRHLVPVVLAAVVEAVHGRADGRPKNGSALDELS